MVSISDLDRWVLNDKLSSAAYTPRLDESPTIILEKPGGNRTIKAEPDNHFERAFEEFHNIIVNPGKTEKHYNDVLLQSKTLEQMEILNQRFNG